MLSIVTPGAVPITNVMLAIHTLALGMAIALKNLQEALSMIFSLINYIIRFSSLNLTT